MSQLAPNNEPAESSTHVVMHPDVSFVVGALGGFFSVWMLLKRRLRRVEIAEYLVKTGRVRT